jgi:hypothetical protein
VSRAKGKLNFMNSEQICASDLRTHYSWVVQFVKENFVDGMKMCAIIKHLVENQSRFRVWVN